MNHRTDAMRIVGKLREAGHEAYFVGGCVRDEILGRVPKDYDIATSARPGFVQGLFPNTIPVGAQFGVIVVMNEGRQTEVATFRADGDYTDGRRPDEVIFSTAKEDAKRRDFTINGLFKDPLTDEIIDYVGGLDDIKAKKIRAIGNPFDRFGEDRLRMLRAVRFADSIGASIESETWDAIVSMSDKILEVSWERIRDELSRMIVGGRFSVVLGMLKASGLLQQILPEIIMMKGVMQEPDFHPEGDVYTHTQLVMHHYDRLPADQRTLVLGLASLFHDVGKPRTYTNVDRIRFNGHDDVGAEMADEILRRLRYQNDIVADVVDLIKNHMAFVQIKEWRGAKVRRFLERPLAATQLALHKLDCCGIGVNHPNPKLEAYNWCMDKLEEYAKEPPKPPKLLNGHELMTLGYPGGPTIGKVLALLDDERLEGRLSTKEEAVEWLLREHAPAITEDQK